MSDDDLHARLARAEARLAHFEAAQRISHVGSYDFEIASNTNDWSDQLYRIYGREPGSFNASYEKFLEMVHPDDRDMIMRVHQEAMATLSPYQMEERIVWPDGQVRTLASWGEVIADAEGRPARMVGICWDITEQKASAEALQRSSERFDNLMQSAPDVVLVMSADGIVLRANEHVQHVLGHPAAELTGRPLRVLLPRGLHLGETVARHADGHRVPVDISASEVDLDGEPVTVAFLRDITDRKEHERLALRVHDGEVRRRHALEINDNVVQGLASVLYLLDLDRPDAAHAAARATLEAARGMMDDLLTEADTPLVPGQLIRAREHVGTLQDLRAPIAQPRPDALRVLLADDAADIRLLLRLTLSGAEGFDVVGEATNGEEAVEQAAVLQPDVVVLDLSMPVMDGLQAIPEVLRVSPGSRVVVLSGFDEGRMKQTALNLGADEYLEKGDASALVHTLIRLFPAHPLAATAGTPA